MFEPSFRIVSECACKSPLRAHHETPSYLNTFCQSDDVFRNNLSGSMLSMPQESTSGLTYTNGEQHGIAENEDELVKDLCEVWCSKGGIVDHQRLLVIAGGYESGGRTLILDVLHGEITEEIIRHITCPAVDIKEFFEKVEEEYRSLQLIPCPGRETQEAHRVPERAEEISEEEVKAQTGEWFGFTDLDWQFVRQVYRRCGWPDAFRRQQAVELIGDFMASNKDRTHEWEPAFR